MEINELADNIRSVIYSFVVDSVGRAKPADRRLPGSKVSVVGMRLNKGPTEKHK